MKNVAEASAHVGFDGLCEALLSICFLPEHAGNCLIFSSSVKDHLLPEGLQSGRKYRFCVFSNKNSIPTEELQIPYSLRTAKMKAIKLFEKATWFNEILLKKTLIPKWWNLSQNIWCSETIHYIGDFFLGRNWKMLPIFLFSLWTETVLLSSNQPIVSFGIFCRFT